MTVLFVCGANVNRSQIAEAIFNRVSKTNRAVSAGLRPPRPGAPLAEEHNNPIEPMKSEGYDLSRAKVKALDEDTAASAEKVVVLLNRERYEAKLPDYLRKRSDLEFWDVERISDDVSSVEYYRLEKERIRKIEGLVRDLVQRLG
jgi:protein-tyrosine-phosphatase